MTPGQLARIRAVVMEKAKLHKELRKPLTLAGARRVCTRELVALSFREYPRPAQLIRTPNGWKIVVDSRSSDRERLVCIAHELGHLWLHYDRDRDDPIVFDRTGPAYDAMREAEADHLAELLVCGPAKLPGAKPVTRRRRHLPKDDIVKDADDAALFAMVHDAARSEAKPQPPFVGPRVQFAIRREAWLSVDFLELQKRTGRYPHYTNVETGPDYELVTCSADAAAAMVPMLFRAGYKRTAAQLRRRVRQALDRRERTPP